jgi:hypothetical protein
LASIATTISKPGHNHSRRRKASPRAFLAKLFGGAKIPKINRADGPTIELFFFLFLWLCLVAQQHPYYFNGW